MKFSVKLCLALSLLFTFSCKKKNTTSETPTIANVTINTSLPSVATVSIFSVTAQSALCKATVSSEGSSALTAVGVCWDTVPGPTTLRNYWMYGVGTGSFNCTLPYLKPNTTYYVRAYATNASGTAYGSEMHFTTLDSWKAVLLNKNVTSMVISDNNIIVGASDGIYISSSEGNTWTPVPDMFSINIYGLAKSNSYIFASTSSGLYRSSDNGNSWTPVDIGVNSPYVGAIAAEGNTVFVVSNIYGLRRSVDNGTTWVAVTGLTTSGNNIHCIAISGTNVYVGSTYSGIFQSNDGGVNWTPNNLGLQPSNNIYALAFSGNNILLGTSNGIYLSTVGSSSWAQVTSVTSGIYSFAISGSTVFAGGYFAYVSSNNGSSFTQMNAGTGSTIMAMAVGTQYIYAGAYGIYRMHR